MPVAVKASGPLFDGRAKQAMRRIVAAIAHKLAVEGQRRVLQGLDATLRRPTGAYRSRVTLYESGTGQARVHDDRAIYGPWLEGTGSRNATTRFKGYANFRKAYQELDRAAVPLAEHVIAQHIAELGG
jgi:hypothetical protein